MLPRVVQGEWSAWIHNGQLKIQTPDGQVVRVRGGILSGQHGRDGRDGVPGEPGKSIKGDKGDRGHPGESVRGDRGEPGQSIKGDKGDKGDAVVGPPGPPGESIQGPPGKNGLNGKDGDIGPVPLHEVDPPENPYRIRFQIGWTAQHKVKWGQWIDLRKLLPKLLPQQQPARMMGPISLDRQQIIQIIEDTMTTSPLAGYLLQDEDSDQTVKYYGYMTKGGAWYVRRVDDTGEPAAYRFAANSNNLSVTSYTAAWTARASLTYQYLSDLHLP